MDSHQDATSKVASPVPASRKGYRTWTDRELKYLSRHREDGAEMIAEALGRSVSSVKAKAFVKRISLFRVPGLARCPVCGINTISPHSQAARQGMCVPCWERRKADMFRQKRDEEAAKREYDRERRPKKGGSDAQQDMP